MKEFFAKEILLGLTVQEFLLHLLNFAILVVALYFLLYKPVRKFMQKRKESYEEAERKYNEQKEYVDKAESTASRILDDAHGEAVRIAEEAHALAAEQSKAIIADAKSEADKIIKDAKDDADKALIDEKEKLYASVGDLAVNISGKILSREVKSEDNDAFIDAIINEVSKDEENA